MTHGVRVLFISNGHGEVAIAARIAREVRVLCPDARLDHLALVGAGERAELHAVGPRRALPSGGLIAMGNVPNIVRDLRAGLLGLTFAQRRFLRANRGVYDVAVVVGDVFGLWMARALATPIVYAGTAKSVAVAPYGRFEERLLARTARCFVRDAATAERLRRHGVACEPANAIVDLFDAPEPEGDARDLPDARPRLLLLPGSRAEAYSDGRFSLRVVRELAATHPHLGGVLSIAGTLDPERFAAAARADGWNVLPGTGPSPFRLALGERIVVQARRELSVAVLRASDVVLGQAGTANEAAAALGVPVVAFQRGGRRAGAWYRRRQMALLGEALYVATGGVAPAAREVAALLADAPRRARMGAIGRARMGDPGGARRIAQAVVAVGGERAS